MFSTASPIAPVNSIAAVSSEMSFPTRDGEVADRIILAKTQTKGHEARSVPVSRRLRKEEGYLGTLYKRDPTRPLFCSQKGGGFTAHGITLLLKRMFESAGVKGASSHSGRRTFATRLADKGVCIRVIQRFIHPGDGGLCGSGRTPASGRGGVAMMAALMKLGWLAYAVAFLASYAGLEPLFLGSLSVWPVTGGSGASGFPSA